MISASMAVYLKLLIIYLIIIPLASIEMDIKVKWKDLFGDLGEAPTFRLLPNVVIKFTNTIKFGFLKLTNALGLALRGIILKSPFL